MLASFILVRLIKEVPYGAEEEEVWPSSTNTAYNAVADDGYKRMNRVSF
jgi:hypothetical protein